MLLNPNSLSTNILVTLLTLVMVFALPWLDRTVCNKLGLSLNDRLSTNPKADRLLHLRKWLLVIMFGVYLLLVLYVTFLSRSAAEDYTVNAELFEGLKRSINIDFGILGFIASIFTDGPEQALAHVRIQHFENLAQVYMNICMFIPMGYLLPYIFDWFRRRVRPRTIATCFLASLAIENIQLLTRMGFYDVDDLFANTLGGIIGVYLYIGVAYILAHPDWRDRFRFYRLWRKDAVKSAMFPFFRKLHLVRSTIYGTDSAAALDFYVTKLGMYPLNTLYDEKTNTTRHLLEYGNSQLELICTPGLKIKPQTITIACNNSEYLKKRLLNKGIEVSKYSEDSYTGLRTYSIKGPDNVTITIIEE